MVNMLESPLAPLFRLNDFLSYIKISHEIEMKNDKCMLVLTYNNSFSIYNLIAYALEFSIDILVVDNNSTDNTFQLISESFKDRINIICLTTNLGGAGGYAVGQEWVIERGYKYCLMTEDDAIPVDKDLISEMLENALENRIVQCRYDGLNGQLFTLHFTLYPCLLFELAGVINANLFFRYDDYEYALRLQKYASEYNFEAICIERTYSHPYLKEGFSVLASYFMLRNCMIIFCSIGNFFFPFKMLFINMLFAIYSLIQGKGYNLCALIFSAIHDFCFFKKEKNIKVLEKYKNIKIEPRFKVKLQFSSFKEFAIKFSNYTGVTSLSKNIGDFHCLGKNGYWFNNIILGKYSMPTSVFAGLGSNIVFIESIDLTTKSIGYWEYENSNRIKSTFYFILSILFTTIIVLSLFPFLFIFGIFHFLKSRKIYPIPLKNKLFKRNWDNTVVKL
jgi:hypothetical protein